MATCVSCGGHADPGSRSGMCRPCKFPPRPVRLCECGAKLGRPNKSGACRKCSLKVSLRNPAIEAKRLARLAVSNSDMELNRLRASFLIAEAKSPEGRARRAELRRQRLAWCPDNYRRFYQLKLRRGYRAAEAKQLTLERMREDLHSMSPFERQLEAIRRGAGIVEKFTPRATEPIYSQVGCASAMAAYG